ncbi:MAG: Stf0 family sulfotransferase [Amaricoccus sp.]
MPSAAPRSGSTLLCRMLAASGVAGRPNSYFRQEDAAGYARRWRVPPGAGSGDAGFDRAYLAAMAREGTGDSGIFGVRIMWPSVADAARRLGGARPADFPSRFAAVFGPACHIHLARLDKVAQAVSLLRAEQSGLWHRAADGTMIEGVERPGPVCYDAARIATLVEGMETEDAAWSRLFAECGIEPLRLTCEALSDDPRSALAGILSALGRDPRIAGTVAADTARMADGTSRAWVERFRSGLGSLAATRHDTAEPKG